MFGIADFAAFCTAILVFLALPGPGTFALLGSTAQGGLRAGTAATLGLIVGDQVLLWLAVGGLSALMATHPTLFNVVRWVGAGYLAWIGWKLLTHREGENAAPVRIAPHHFFRQALLITVLNPKAIVFYMAFFPLFIDPARHEGLRTFAVMAVTIAVITLGYCLALCALAQVVSDQVRRHRRLAAWLQRLAGVLMIGFGLRLLRD
jgi:threonine/homoserine/homoserine lactone efflux protein